MISYFTPHNHYYENLNGKEVCIDDEIPFEIPDNWTWTRIGNIINIVRGGSPRPISKYISSSEDGYNWIKIGDSEIDGKFITSCRQRIIKEGLSKTRFVHAGDFLLTNSMSYGRPYILKIDGCIHDGWLALTDQFDVYNQDYLYHLLKSSAVREQIDNLVAGSVVNNLNKDKVGTILVPLLSKSEQLHIVSIIEELGVIVNELKQSIELLNHIDSTVGKKLFASTLRGAIQGKLVPQDPSEQPVVIDCKNPIIRRDNSYYELIENQELCLGEEIPFVIPESWLWIRFEDLVCFNLGRTPSRAKEHYWSGGTIPWVSIGDMPERGVLTNTKEKITPVGFQDNYSKMCPIGTLIMSFKLSIGKICYTQIESVHNEAIIDITIKEPQECNYDWLYYVLPYVSRNTKSASAIKGNTLNKDSMRKMLIPLPPIQEQQRIISKLKELQALLDTLE